MRILVVRFSSIGDIVLTTPVFRLLKTHFPDAEIHWVTKTSFASVLEGNPYIDRTWKWDDDQDRKVLREFYFDNVQAGESAPRFYQALRDAISAHSADAARAKSLAESGTGPRFEHRA